jgi:ribosomal protein S12 methylthiotransferase accessory factor
MQLQAHIGTEAGAISGNLYDIPNRWFLPKGLCQVSCDAENLSFVGVNTNRVLGSSIAFSRKQAILSTFGEYVERYGSAFEPLSKLRQGSYNDMIVAGHNVIHPDKLKYYADWQFDNPKFPYKKLTTDSKVAWVEGVNLTDNKPIWVPALSVFLPHNCFFDNEIQYSLNTSTGIAAGATVKDVMKSGFLECTEREAFTRFWYCQKQLLPQIPIYSTELILEQFRNNVFIKRLFANRRVKITTFDLSSLVPVQTVVVFLYFKYKGKIMQSMGAASRFLKEDAIIKATLEAYQGIEYAIMLDKIESKWTSNEANFSDVNEFSRHFAFYNRFPEYRQEIPILQEALKSKGNTNTIECEDTSRTMSSFADLSICKLDDIIYVPLTTPDIKDLGYEVGRIIIPEWSLLTGMHDRPFLGAKHWGTPEDLFLNFPHPFP